jgi:hypothetical protein
MLDCRGGRSFWRQSKIPPLFGTSSNYYIERKHAMKQRQPWSQFEFQSEPLPRRPVFPPVPSCPRKWDTSS